jgi:hypothetical protein
LDVVFDGEVSSGFPFGFYRYRNYTIFAFTAIPMAVSLAFLVLVSRGLQGKLDFVPVSRVSTSRVGTNSRAPTSWNSPKPQCQRP